MPLADASTKIKKPLPSSNKNSLLSELDGLFSGDHISASGGLQYSEKNFGRDSAISMIFLLHSLENLHSHEDHKAGRYIIEQVIKSLVHWQGQKAARLGRLWRKNAEEPGKIHHEAGPQRIDELLLSARWQDDDDKNSDMLVYFGSVDSTPLFVRLVCQYVMYLKKHDPTGHEAYRLLMTKVQNFRGTETTVLSSLLAAVRWIEVQLQVSDLGLLEYQRRPGQEQGLPNQTWKDSLTSYVHTSGRLANTNQPVASVEVQGLAFDALMMIAKMFESDQLLSNVGRVNKNQIKIWRQRAEILRQNILTNFWHDKRFAQAVDRHPRSGKPRSVSTPSSNELHLLNSQIFDDMDQTDKRIYLESLIRQAMSDEFLTDSGIRCRAKSQYKLINFADYHGSWAVWPWESHWIATGLRCQGFNKLADEVDRRILNAFTVSGSYLEYYLADPRSESVYYRFVPLDWGLKIQSQPGSIAAATMPDTPQTWSLTAAIDIRAALSSVHPVKRDHDLWLAGLEKDILLKIKHIALLTDETQISKLREISHAAVIDRVRGRAADERYHRMAGTPAPVLLPAV